MNPQNLLIETTIIYKQYVCQGITMGMYPLTIFTNLHTNYKRNQISYYFSQRQALLMELCTQINWLQTRKQEAK